MEWLLVVGVMAVFGAIAFFMHRVGISFRKPVSFREKKYIHTKERPCTIIFGKSELADKLIAADTDIIPDVYHACGGRDPWLDMNHIVRDYFLEHKDVYKNYVYDEIEELGHE